MDQHRLNFLASVAMFANLPRAELEEIADDFHIHTYASETTLFWEGDEAQTFYIVAAGRVRLYKLSLDGREQPLFVMRPRDFFDIPPLLDNQPHPASATTLTDARLYVTSRDRMVEIMQRHPQVAGALLPYLSKRLRELAALTGDLAFTNVSTRLARLILVYAREEGEPTPHGIQLSWGLSHRQIAYLIGTAREVVTRSLHHFKQQGVLHSEHGRLVIDDWEALQEIANSL
jgi:CRP/FNR family transcriptional regulator